MVKCTHVYMPNTLFYVIRARSITQLGGVASDDIVPLLVLKIPDRAREETGANKIKQAG